MQDDQLPPIPHYTILYQDSTSVRVIKQMVSWNGYVIDQTVVNVFDEMNCGHQTPYFAAVKEAKRLNEEFAASLR